MLILIRPASYALSLVSTGSTGLTPSRSVQTNPLTPSRHESNPNVGETTANFAVTYANRCSTKDPLALYLDLYIFTSISSFSRILDCYTEYTVNRESVRTFIEIPINILCALYEYILEYH